MKCWKIHIIESSEITAITYAYDRKEAEEKARRGDYDKQIESAVCRPDKIVKIKMLPEVK